jgi:acetylornithine deacetylase/succinyl-diaminopimelate desuccinylase-like protein
VLDEDHPLVQGVADAAAEVLGARPAVSRWHFSTNGVATMGLYGIPTVGFAPGREELAHTTQERVRIDDLLKATAVYSVIPEVMAEKKQ